MQEEKDITIKMLSCNHTFCSECFSEFYRTQIEDENKSHNLVCPQYGCTVKPTIEEIKNIISDDCFAKYKKFQQNKMVLRDKNLFFCPTRDCESVLNRKEMDKKTRGVKCSKCKISYCPKCK